MSKKQSAARRLSYKPHEDFISRIPGASPVVAFPFGKPSGLRDASNGEQTITSTGTPTSKVSAKTAYRDSVPESELSARSTSANAHQKPASPATQFKEGYIEVTGPRLPEGLPVSQAAMAPVAGTVGLDTDLEGSVVDVPMDLSSAATSVLSSTEAFPWQIPSQRVAPSIGTDPKQSSNTHTLTPAACKSMKRMASCLNDLADKQALPIGKLSKGSKAGLQQLYYLSSCEELLCLTVLMTALTESGTSETKATALHTQTTGTFQQGFIAASLVAVVLMALVGMLSLPWPGSIDNVS